MRFRERLQRFMAGRYGMDIFLSVLKTMEMMY